MTILALDVSCSFVIRRSGDPHYRDHPTYEEMTAHIQEFESARARGVPLGEWFETVRERHPRESLYWSFDCPESWDLMLGRLYATRSAAVVYHHRYVSMSVSMFRLGMEIPGFHVFGVILLPFEIVAAPCWVVVAAIIDANIDDEELERAVRDIVRARSLGYKEDLVEGSELETWPTWPSGYYHLDRIGYDAAWLRKRCGEESDPGPR